MRYSPVSNQDGKLIEIRFSDLYDIEDLHKAKEILNRLILEISIPMI